MPLSYPTLILVPTAF